jgi:hypothetical protein
MIPLYPQSQFQSAKALETSFEQLSLRHAKHNPITLVYAISSKRLIVSNFFDLPFYQFDF